MSTGTGASVIVGSSGRGIVRSTFGGLTTDAERVQRLIRAVESIYSELDEEREFERDRRKGLIERLDRLDARLDEESTRLETLAREVGSHDVRLQLAGLVSVALGTTLLAVPAVWDLVASI